MNNVSGYFKKQTNFLLSATQPRQYPNVVFPEISFIGRSNVGKSSLINAIFMKKLAHTSNTPGKTRQINFFNHGDSLMVADLPGYGFAKISQSEAYKISDLVSQYLRTRENLKKIFVLIDNTLGPKKIDIEMIESMRDIKEKIFICYTKSDKKIKEKSAFSKELEKFDHLIVSSKTNSNIFDVQKKILEIL
ncbi:MAG: YihA family ribosome biogenesis GTP-binding protein [alpha proteobacterium HIMB59]|jgi:GTP-binding protein|nr:MAG: YihA family ribosome biogenesis GTP-binding protein [alpha proteobacterium HIMB59]|tara:strand:- start:217 stop:789 length:573 start_codon:yes stop_codon:yes gene_type:complete